MSNAYPTQISEDDERKRLGIPAASPQPTAAPSIRTVEVTPADAINPATTASLVSETKLFCGTVVKHYE